MLNRTLQREILAALRDAYPRPIFINDVVQVPKKDLAMNFCYLAGHGLVEGGTIHSNASGEIAFGKPAVITARGLDFLEDDGGLSAILGIVTIKLHSDTIRDLLAAKIEASAASTEEKGMLMKQLAALPATALQAAISDLVQLGVSHLPNLSTWLQKLSGLG